MGQIISVDMFLEGERWRAVSDELW